MLPQHVLLALIGACAAVPLNINLGAYSPALVVGDGEISLGSSESASELMATLASGANEADANQQGQQEQPQEGEQTQEQPPAGGEGGEGQGEGEQNQEQPAEENAAKRDLADIVKRIPAPQDHLDAMASAMDWIKRDLPGFNAALSYAREAMQNTPKIEMGSEGAGVGIVVNAGLNVPANSAANGQPPAGGERKAKRDEVVEEEGEAPKMTLVAITEV